MNAEEFKAAIEAVDLTAVDAKDKIFQLNAGLMESNTNLLTESKANKTKAQEANEATELARQEAAKAKELELIASGKTEELKAHYEAQLAEGVATANQQTKIARDALIERDKGSVVSDILSKVDERYRALVKTQLMQDTSITYIDGKPVTEIKHGDDSYSSVSEFLDGVKDTEWKHYLKAISLSGAGTKQTKGGEQSKKPQDMTTSERIDFKERDPVGFKQAFNL